MGHPSTDAPAYACVDSFDCDADAECLYANLHQIERAFAELVKAGRFKQVSMQYFRPSQGNNPVPGTWYPKYVGFLGAAAPAVSDLRTIVQYVQDVLTLSALTTGTFESLDPVSPTGTKVAAPVLGSAAASHGYR